MSAKTSTLFPRFGAPTPGGDFYCLSAVIGDLSKVGDPLFNDLTASGLDYIHNVAQRTSRDAGIVVA